MVTATRSLRYTLEGRVPQGVTRRGEGATAATTRSRTAPTSRAQDAVGELGIIEAALGASPARGPAA